MRRCPPSAKLRTGLLPPPQNMRWSGKQDQLADDSPFSEQFLCPSRLGKRKSLRDDRLDLLLPKQLKKCNQVLSKQFRFQPLERLDTVRNHPFSAREEAGASDVQAEPGGSPKAPSTTGTT